MTRSVDLFPQRERETCFDFGRRYFMSEEDAVVEKEPFFGSDLSMSVGPKVGLQMEESEFGVQESIPFDTKE